MKPLRLFILDDGPWKTYPNVIASAQSFDEVVQSHENENSLVKLAAYVADEAKKASVPFECCVAGTLDEGKPRLWLDTKPTIKFKNWAQFLSEFDVAIIDFRGIGGKAGLQKTDLPDGCTLNDAEFKELTEEGTNDPVGAAFFLKQHKLHSFANYRAVFLLSQTDTESLPHLAKTVDQLATSGMTPPWIVKLEPSEDSNQRIAFLCRVFLEEHKRGFTSLAHSDIIEFAAHHDRPVVIIGETGTGKEWTARRIHLRWSSERIIRGETANLREHFKAINCAAIPPTLARSELFGHVKGSFTGAFDHNLGLILAACGCKPPRKRKGKDLSDECTKAFQALLAKCSTPPATDIHQKAAFLDDLLPELNGFLDHQNPHVIVKLIDQVQKKLMDKMGERDWSDDFASGLMENNKSMFDEEGDDLVFKRKNPIGTLFLDEFGDMHPEVQTLLLRFLQGGEDGLEIQPVGFKGCIRGLRLRVVVATSDPAVARFFGCDDITGSWRSEHEHRSPRQDLLFRLKTGTIIRQPPVTLENFREEFDRILDHCGDPKLWKGTDGKTTALELIEQHLDKLRKASQKESSVPAFGHRREIRGLIEKAELWINTAKPRGMRHADHTKKVTSAVVKQVWKPSMLDLTPKPSSAGGASTENDADGVAVNRLHEAFTKVVKDTTGEEWDKTAEHLKKIKSQLLDSNKLPNAKRYCTALLKAKKDALAGFQRHMNTILEKALPGIKRGANSQKANDAFNAAFNPKTCKERKPKRPRPSGTSSAAQRKEPAA